MEIAIISDSHIPSREPGIPEWALERIREADHTIHAGDFDSSGALADLRHSATRLTAVRGNMDPVALGLPEVNSVRLGGVEFVLTHGTGPKQGYKKRVASAVSENKSDGPTVGIAGHTHEPMDETIDGIRVLNPGSVTGASPASEETMMIADVADGNLSVSLLSGE